MQRPTEFSCRLNQWPFSRQPVTDWWHCWVGAVHSVYVNRGTRKSSSVPRQREINEFLARKICRDLEIPMP